MATEDVDVYPEDAAAMRMPPIDQLWTLVPALPLDVKFFDTFLGIPIDLSGNDEDILVIEVD